MIEPPVVVCPGCRQPVEVEHLTHATLDGHTVHAPMQTEHEALLQHMGCCPNVTPQRSP